MDRAEARLRRWRDVELAALEGMVAAGIAPAEALAELPRRRPATSPPPTSARIDEIEKTTKHDVIAFLTFMEERIGPDARWLHCGMTSSDVLDTSLGLHAARRGRPAARGRRPRDGGGEEARASSTSARR